MAERADVPQQDEEPQGASTGESQHERELQEERSTDLGRQLLASLFDTLGVGRVVVIDDEYEAGVGDEWFVDVLGRIQNDHGNDVFSLLSIELDSDGDWYDALRGRISGVDAGERLRISRVLRDRYPEETNGIAFFSEPLATLVGDQREFLQLSPIEWARERNRLITLADEGEKWGCDRTLFLFDHELGGTEPQGLNGRQLLEKLRADAQRPVLCGILSGQYGKDAEAEEAAGDPNAPVYLSKERLTDEPESFAYRVRLTAMTAVVGDVIDTAIKILRAAQLNAEGELQQLGVNSLERVILQLSHEEGVWEADTIFRIFGIYQRKAARAGARRDRQLDEALDTMRTVGGIGRGIQVRKPLELKRIQALEMYEDPTDINPHFLPVELGDCFEITTGPDTEHFVLLGQPCDLSLRPPSDVEDPSTRQVKPPLTWLVRLMTAPLKKWPPRNLVPAMHELPYYGEDFGSAWADFRSATPAPLDVTDLCAFSRSGQAELEVSQDPPPGLLPAWRHRFLELRKLYSRELEHRTAAQGLLEAAGDMNSMPEELRRHILSPGVVCGLIGSPSIDRSLVNFRCKRVRRLVQPYAGVLLIRFARYLSREAFEVDLGRDT